MARYSRAEVELVLKTLGYQDARKKLKQVEGDIRKLRPVAQRAFLGVKKAGALAFGSLIYSAKRFAQTMGSAILRTLSYGVINMARSGMRRIRESITGAAEASLAMARAATIMARGGRETTGVYNTLTNSLLRVDKYTMLATTDVTGMGLALAKGGLSAQEFDTAMKTLNTILGVTGEKSEGMSLQFLKMARVFGITSDKFEEFGDILLSGATSATATIKDFLEAVKNVGPTMILAYGKGTESVKQFVTAVATMVEMGNRGSRAGTAMSRMMSELMAPTSQTIRMMTKYGFELYKNSAYSGVFSSALKSQHRAVSRLDADLERLVATERRLAAGGRNEEKVAKTREKIAAIQSKINAEVQASERYFEEFVEAGGKVKPVIEMVKQFRDAVDAGKITSTELAGILRKIFGMRGKRSIESFVVAMGRMEEIGEKVANSIGLGAKQLEQLEKSFGGMHKMATIAFDKLKTTVGMILGAGIVGPIMNSVKRNIIQPISKTLTDSQTWRVMSEDLIAVVSKAFEPFTKTIGELMMTTFFPEKFGFERGTAVYKTRISNLSKVVLAQFGKVAALIGVGLKAIGRTLGSALIDGVLEGIMSKIPLLNQLTVKAFEEDELRKSFNRTFIKSLIKDDDPAKSWGHVKSAAAGKSAEIPAEFRQQAVQYATQMKLMGRKPGGRPGTFESLDTATLISTKVAGIVGQMNRDSSERITKEFTNLESKISKSFALVEQGGAIHGPLGETTAKELAEALGGRIISLKEDLTGAMHTSNNVQEKLIKSLINEYHELSARYATLYGVLKSRNIKK